MDPNSTSALPIARISLRILIVGNWLLGAFILALLTATFVAEQWTFAALGIKDASSLPSMVMGLRAVAVLGLVAIPLNYTILRRLAEIVDTVRADDPFVSANAARLRAIAWALLWLQLLGMAIGAIGKVISTPAHPLHLDAGFSINGWLAVLLTFILAHVFTAGASMRRDLDGMV